MAFFKKPLCALVGLLISPLACGETDAQSPSTGTGGRTPMGYGGASAGASDSLAGDGGVSGSAAGASAGGSSSGGVAAGGALPIPSGGASGGAQFGGRPSVLAAGGTSGGRPQETAGAGGSTAPVLCTRFGLEAQSFARQVAWGHAATLLQDCRLSGLYNVQTAPELIVTVNRLVAFNRELWGCDQTPPSDFALSLGTSRLSADETELLISIYLDVATSYLKLSSNEKAKLNVELQALAKPLITNQPGVFEHSECGAPGGEGGAPGSAGAGGNPSAAGAGGTR